MAKSRADQLLVDRGLAESRARAQALILAGLVFSGGRKVEKAGQPLAPDAPLEVGMVCTVEPGIYLPGVGGVRIEDQYVITEKGAKNFCTLPKDLEWSTL